MAEPTVAGFGCKACGRHFSWKPELARKRVKCRCGSVISVPISGSEAPKAPAISRPTYITPAPTEIGGYDLSALKEAAAAPVQETGYRCPSCENPMIPGDFVCNACGFNLRTKQKAFAGSARTVMQPAIVPSAAAGSLVPGYAGKPAGRPVDSSDKSKILLGVGGVAVLAAAILAFKLLSSGGATKTKLLGDDAKVLQAIKDENGQDLEQWIGDGNTRMVMGMSSNQAIARAKNLKSMGATRVLAFGGMMTRTLAIELPDDPQQRGKLFDWAAGWNKDVMEQPPVDVGQHYIWLNMHI